MSTNVHFVPSGWQVTPVGSMKNLLGCQNVYCMWLFDSFHPCPSKSMLILLFLQTDRALALYKQPVYSPNVVK